MSQPMSSERISVDLLEGDGGKPFVLIKLWPPAVAYQNLDHLNVELSTIEDAKTLWKALGDFLYLHEPPVEVDQPEYIEGAS